MNREVEFRSWDIEDKTMIIDEQNFIPLKITNKGVLRLNPKYKDDLWEIIDKDRFVILEYTGLKDKNGVKIYEGDILKCKLYNGKYENYLVVWDKEDACFDALNSDKSNFMSPSIWHEFEIIGNKFENPDLLEVT